MKDRLKKIRKENIHGKTQQTFAEYLGIPVENLKSYECGRRNLSDAVVALICQKCGIEEKWLRTGDGNMKKPVSEMSKKADQAAQIYGMDPDSFQYRFLTELLELSDDELDAVENFMKRIINGGV